MSVPPILTKFMWMILWGIEMDALVLRRRMTEAVFPQGYGPMVDEWYLGEQRCTEELYSLQDRNLVRVDRSGPPGPPYKWALTERGRAFL